MKKIAILLLAAGLTFGMFTPSHAIDYKIKGVWEMVFDYGQNAMFSGGGDITGFNRSQDEFEARQRARIGLEAIASESLSGTVNLEIGAQTWGKGGTSASGGAALGADSSHVIKLRHAYIDWIIPQTEAKIRMGIQPFALPSFTSSTQVFQDDVAAITINYPFNEMISVTAFWLRPFNDNYTGDDGYRANYMDNMDVAGLILPLRFEGFRLTPWGIYAGIGPNTFRAGGNLNNYFSNVTGVSAAHIRAGLFPAGGSRHRDGTPADKKLSQYGNAWWVGLTGQVTLFDPFTFAWDFNYGSVSWTDDSRLNKQGWLGSLLFEYKLDWGIPGLYGWYASGDDDNPANGSERLPAISAINANNQFSNFAFTGQNLFHGGREAMIGYTMAGTWGIGARLKNMSFIKDLKHTFRINYIGGTNSPTMAKKITNRFGGLYEHGPNSSQWGNVLGMDPMYLTTNDSALEFGLFNSYKMYENLEITVEADYIVPWLDQSRSVWGNSKMNGKSDDVRDPWNINLTFLYSF